MSFGELDDDRKKACFPKSEYKTQIVNDLKKLIAWEGLNMLDLPKLGYAMCSDLRNWRHKKTMIISLDDGLIVGYI